MSQRKNSLIILLSLILIITSMFLISCDGEVEGGDDKKPTNAVDLAVEDVNDYKFTLLEDGTYEVSNYVGTHTNIRIPKKYNNVSITSIGANAFDGENNPLVQEITRIVIPEGIKSVATLGLYNLQGLKTLELPSTLTTINETAFAGLPFLKTIKMSDSNTVYKAQNNCLIEIATNTLILGSNGATSIPQGVTKIAEYSFYCMYELYSITIPSSVTEIEDDAFYMNIFLTEICNLSTSITLEIGSEGNGYIAEHALAIYTTKDYSSKLSEENGSIIYTDGSRKRIVKCLEEQENITVSNGITEIGQYAFSSYNSIKNVIISNTITLIDSYAFSNCANLESVTIPNSVTTINEYAFGECKNLGCITIPESVTTINEYAFDSCINLYKVNITSIASWLAIDFENAESNPVYYANNLYLNNSILTNLVIPDSTISIKEYAFDGCLSLTSIKIPSSVTEIGYDAFYGCYLLVEVCNLSSLAINAGSTPFQSSIDVYTTSEYTSKLSIDNDFVIYTDGTKKTVLRYIGNDEIISIPSVATAIANKAFSNSGTIKNVTMPNSITTMGEDTFANCKFLESVTLSNSIKRIADYAFKGCIKLHGVAIPNGVEEMGGWAFYYCESLKSILLPSSLTTYNYFAFEGSGLISIVIPEGTESLSMNMFANCTNLTTFTLPSTLLTIEMSTFQGCTALTNLIIPEGVETIDYSSFSGCTNLASVSIPSSVSTINPGAFAYCTSLTNLTVSNDNPTYKSEGNCIIKKATNVLVVGCNSSVIPNTVTEIGSRSFIGCVFTTIAIPNSVITIAERAFNNCEKMTSIIIPNSVKKIDTYALSSCYSLTTITIPSSVTHISYRALSFCYNIVSVTFENTTGWYYTSSETDFNNSVSGTEITNIAEIAADYDTFDSEYGDGYLYRIAE